jgi:hypothetical protein
MRVVMGDVKIDTTRISTEASVMIALAPRTLRAMEDLSFIQSRQLPRVRRLMPKPAANTTWSSPRYTGRSGVLPDAPSHMNRGRSSVELRSSFEDQLMSDRCDRSARGNRLARSCRMRT